MNDDGRDSALVIAELKGDLKALQERMNTMQAQYAGALDRFRADFQSTLRSHLLAIIGAAIAIIAINIAAVGLGVAFLSLQGRQPMSPVIIQTMSEPAPAEIHAVPETLPEAGAAEPTASPQTDG